MNSEIAADSRNAQMARKIDMKNIGSNSLDRGWPTRGSRAARGFCLVSCGSYTCMELCFSYMPTSLEFNKINSCERKVWGDAHESSLVWCGSSQYHSKRCGS